MGSGGGGHKPGPIPAAPPPVKKTGVEVEAAKSDIREQMRRKQGLASTRLTQPGTLYGKPSGNLKQTLG
jgi:hypothetical protein